MASNLKNSIRSVDGRFKRCARCKEWKSLDSFGKSKHSVDGHNPYCALCHRARGAEAAKRRPPDRGKKEYAKYRDYYRAYGFKRRYGLSLQAVLTILAQQGNRCGLCEDPLEARKAFVDHDHETGQRRAILCRRCNVGIGMFRENSKLIAKAARYVRNGGLKKPPFRLRLVKAEPSQMALLKA